MVTLISMTNLNLMKMMNKLIGISGFARSGKDTFYKRCSNILGSHNEKCKNFSFADALKQELDELLIKHTGISAYTSVDSEKQIIRPLLVTYGTEIRRRINPNCWVEKIESSVIEYLNKGYYVFVTDVRFLNEANWVKNQGGYLFNIQRDGIGPANKDEKDQYRLFRYLIDYTVSWPTFDELDTSSYDNYVIKLFDTPNSNSRLFPKNYSIIDSKPGKNFQTETPN